MRYNVQRGFRPEPWNAPRAARKPEASLRAVQARAGSRRRPASRPSLPLARFARNEKRVQGACTLSLRNFRIPPLVALALEAPEPFRSAPAASPSSRVFKNHASMVARAVWRLRFVIQTADAIPVASMAVGGRLGHRACGPTAAPLAAGARLKARGNLACGEDFRYCEKENPRANSRL